MEMNYGLYNDGLDPLKEANPGEPLRYKPENSKRADAWRWMSAPNPMMTLIKTLDVTHLYWFGKRNHYSFNLLMDYCIASTVNAMEEFHWLPVGDKMVKYDAIAVSTIVKNRNGGLNSCDLAFTGCLTNFAAEYREQTLNVYHSCRDRDLSANRMVIGTSTVTQTELDGVIGMTTGIYNNPFCYWGKYRRRLISCKLPFSFQFHHTQMDGETAALFLNCLQDAISHLKKDEIVKK